MARNVTLLALLSDLRQEARISTNAAHNSSSREAHVRLLQRTQEWLWREHAWPHLRVRRYLPVARGQRFYDPRGARLSVDAEAPVRDDLSVQRVESVSVRYGEEWMPLANGIGDMHYSAYDSDLDERSWPVERWQEWEEEQIELWPIPSDDADASSKDGYLRFTGIRDLRPLVADSDRCDLDGDLIVLYAATEMLSAAGAKDAPNKQAAAAGLRDSLVGNSSKVKRFSMVGDNPNQVGPPRRGLPRVHYRDRETS